MLVVTLVARRTLLQLGLVGADAARAAPRGALFLALHVGLTSPWATDW